MIFPLQRCGWATGIIDGKEKEREREKYAIFNRKRSRENNSRGFARCSVCLRKLPEGLNEKCVSMLCHEIDERPFCSEWRLRHEPATFFLVRRFEIITRRRQILTTRRANGGAEGAPIERSRDRYSTNKHPAAIMIPRRRVIADFSPSRLIVTWRKH